MRRRASVERPEFPPWVVDFREWHGAPDEPHPVRYQAWGAEQWEWVERYGYDVFDLDDAEVQWRASREAPST